MNIDLSPGEWAGVMESVKRHVAWLRLADEGDAVEQADDLDRIAGLIRSAIATDAVELPELVPGEPDSEVTCQHVLDAEDVRVQAEVRAAEYERWVNTYGVDAAQRWVQGNRPLQDAGAVCGEPLEVVEELSDYRRDAYWTADGSIVVGKVDSSEGAGVSLSCPVHGGYAVPDVADYL